MRKPIEIENIEELRRREGIEDIALREGIRGLGIGDFVKVTLLTGRTPATGETLLVRITSIKGPAFRGKLASKPVSPGLATLRVGSQLAFTAAHIHSLLKGQPAREQ
jgi:hypothetical protein